MTTTERPAPIAPPPLSAADAPLPAYESYTSLTTYEACPRRYAFRYVERLPCEVRPGQFAFGTAVHRAFEAFVRERIRARAQGDREPGLDVLRRACDEVLQGAGLEPDELERARARAVPALARFLEREAAGASEPVAAELGFGIDVAVSREGEGDPDGIRFVGYIDRVDRDPDGAIEILDYKTGRARSQADVDADRQLTAYAYASARGGLRDPADGEPLPPAARLALYFADGGTLVSTTRAAAALDAFERDLVHMARRVRRREFDARPDPRRCGWCEYRAACAETTVEPPATEPPATELPTTPDLP